MATKFKIFCDDCPQKSSQFEQPPQQLQQQQQQPLQQQQPEDKQGKREPLGLRQAIGLKPSAAATYSQQQSAELGQQHPQSQQQAAAGGANTISNSNNLANSSSTSSALLSVNEEDQENDISMASLGSDFVPSIIHDNDYDHDDRSFECEEDEDGENYACEESSSEILIHDSDDVLDEDFEDEDDEELRLELSQAFKQHDDSQLFKSTIFIEDIDNYLHKLERDIDLRPLPNYMDYQNDIDSDKRAILINWLVEVADEYDLQTETLFICINIIDRFLSKMSIPTSNFQLLGVAAMFIASKYEEIYPPNLYQFVEVTDDTYSGKQICQMEQEILKTLNFRISLPTISFFLRQLFAFNKFSKKVYHLAEYLTCLTLLAEKPFLEYYPSEIALASVILAAHQLGAGGNIQTELKNAYDKSNLDQLKRRQLPQGVKLSHIDRRAYIINKDLPFCIESLRTLQERAYNRTPKILSDSSVIHKYSLETYDCVAQLKPPKVEDLLLY